MTKTITIAGNDYVLRWLTIEFFDIVTRDNRVYGFHLDHKRRSVQLIGFKEEWIPSQEFKDIEEFLTAPDGYTNIMDALWTLYLETRAKRFNLSNAYMKTDWRDIVQLFLDGQYEEMVREPEIYQEIEREFARL